MPRISTKTRPSADAKGDFNRLDDDGPDAMIADLSEPSEGDELPSSFEMKNGDLVPSKREKSADVVPDSAEDHKRNLAEDMDETELDVLGERLGEQIEADIKERDPWKQRFERGLEIMGLLQSELDDGPFPGASNAVHPMIVEACTQYWARSKTELFPPDGPAKAKVWGKQTEQQLDRASRTAEYLNYEMTVLDEGYYAESNRLLWALPMQGCAFRKTFRDPVSDVTMGIFVPAEDFIVPAEASDLRTAARYTHRMRKRKNDIRRLQLVDYYREVDLGDPQTGEEDDVKAAVDEIDGVEPDGDERDTEYEIFECCVDLDLDDDPHMQKGKATGLERSYVVTLERHTRKILAIYRGWDFGDVRFKRRVYFEKWGFVPGLGFYDYGFIHLIGGLQEAATGALRVLLDSAASASLSGGFVSKSANLKGKTLISTPGQWIPVEATGDDLAKAFFPLPVKEPAGALFQLLGHLVDAGSKMAATTEAQTGSEGAQNAPVGSTLALIEQGQKVTSAIHSNNHTSLAREIRARRDLAFEFAHDDGYPYEVEGGDKTIFKQDFALSSELVPVSDPNIHSSVQRLNMAQMVYQIAKESGVIPIKKAVKRILQAAKVPDIDDLIQDDTEPQTYDPNGEIQALLMGLPVRVDPGQLHAAHLQVLAAFASNPQYGGNPMVAQRVGPALAALIGQHLAYGWTTATRSLGIPVGYMDPSSHQTQQPPVPPEQLAHALSMIAPSLNGVPGLPPVKEPGDDGKDNGAADLEIKRQELQLKAQAQEKDLQMKQQMHQFDMQAKTQANQLEQQTTAMKVEAEGKKAESEIQIAQTKAHAEQQQSKAQIDVQRMESNHTMQLSQQQLHLDSQNQHHQHHLDQSNMQQQHAMGQQEMQMKGQQHQQEAHLGQQKMAHERQLGEQKMSMRGQEHQQTLQHGQQDIQQDRLSQLRGPMQGVPGGSAGAPGGPPGGAAPKLPRTPRKPKGKV